jgi:hypothetical protein
VVPQLPGQKQPAIKWKPYQERLPTADEVTRWYRDRWPDAGLAAVLGPVSRLLVIDVDGYEAHRALVARLGAVPTAPMALSGSGEPYRYHLYFRHPAVDTRAKITPWHRQLEFRGRGAVVVLPPSLHRSGNRYRWAEGRKKQGEAESTADNLRRERPRRHLESRLSRAPPRLTPGPIREFPGHSAEAGQAA